MALATKSNFDFSRSDWIFDIFPHIIVKYAQMMTTYNSYNLLWNQLQDQIQKKKVYLEELNVQ